MVSLIYSLLRINQVGEHSSPRIFPAFHAEKMAVRPAPQGNKSMQLSDPASARSSSYDEHAALRFHKQRYTASTKRLDSSTNRQNNNICELSSADPNAKTDVAEIR